MAEPTPSATPTTSGAVPPRLRLDRGELSGAFGDLGTDLPLLAGMILAGGLDGCWTFLFFGLLQMISAVVYGIPMPVQPLKAMAALIIVHGLGGPVIAGGALAIAVMMLSLTVSGTLERLARLVPSTVVRGIQFGLGLKLATLAVGSYLPAEGVVGLALAAGCFGLLIWLRRHRQLPASVIVLVIGVAYALLRGADLTGADTDPVAVQTAGRSLPRWPDIWLGFVMLAVPQLPLSISNSLLATRQLASDWYPHRPVTLRGLGWTYSLFNVAAGLLGGVPVCHGSGGIAGHHAFGGRTGGSVLIYGSFYLMLGLAHAAGWRGILALFPLPVVGVILIIEAGVLAGRIQELRAAPADLVLAILVGVTAAWLPGGFVLATVGGSLFAAIRPERMRARQVR